MRELMVIAVTSSLMLSCRTGLPLDSDAKSEFSPQGVPIDWGRLQPMSTTPLTIEARLANSAAIALNDAASLKDLLSGIPSDSQVIDGIVSVPVKFLANDGHDHNHPFGDGQKNASVDWIGWSRAYPKAPLTSTLAKVRSRTNDISYVLILEPSLEMIQLLTNSAPSNILAEISNDKGDKAVLSLSKDPSRGVYRAIMAFGNLSNLHSTSRYPASVSLLPEWLRPLTDQWAWPRIKVRFYDGIPNDGRYWPLLFRFPAQRREEAQASLPADARHYPGTSKEISLPPYAEPARRSPSEALSEWLRLQPESAKLADFYPAAMGSGVHNRFTPGGASPAIPTATGGVDTYVLKQMIGKNQILFTCFDARDTNQEAQWGVPSGAGWHSIGHELPAPNDQWTYAETVVNTLEKSGIFAGWGVQTPYPFSEQSPFDAKDVATFRVLRSGEVFTTAKYHFHWYAIDAAKKACTTIWKHMGCPLRSDRHLHCI